MGSSARPSWRPPGCSSSASRPWPGSPGSPGPQHEALGTAVGLLDGIAPDRFLVGLAVLNLLSEAAGKQPILCLVGDEQWLDRTSARILAFVAQRLAAGSVVMVFAVREGSDHELTGLTELEIHGLDDADSRALLESVLQACS
ncbi:hypothetical protein [Kribbella monticola]|uniref:hypothetical protein n=1 Tax=Kribbella monticola TaxID=2185285 RepID=UPI0013006B56|nr:hypothetical protein [Kribbella monticola]